MQSFAQVTIGGHLGSDAELRYTATGNAMLNCRVAVGWRKRPPNGEGEWEDRTMWYRVSLMGPKASSDTFPSLLVKGVAVVVTGRLQADIWIPDDDREPRINLDLFAQDMWIADRPAERDGDERGSSRGREDRDYEQTKREPQAKSAPARRQQQEDDLGDLPF